MSEIILKLEFEMEEIDCVSYKCISQSYWDKIFHILTENDKINIQAYSNPSPIEIYGEAFSSKDLLNKIKIISDPKKVLAFKIFHGESFCTGDDMLGQLFNKCEEYVKNNVNEDINGNDDDDNDFS